MSGGVAVVSRVDPDYYTQSRDLTDIDVAHEQERRTLGRDVESSFGTVRVRNAMRGSKSVLIGPNCPGVLDPGLRVRIGIAPYRIFKAGGVGVVSVEVVCVSVCVGGAASALFSSPRFARSKTAVSWQAKRSSAPPMNQPRCFPGNAGFHRGMTIATVSANAMKTRATPRSRDW